MTQLEVGDDDRVNSGGGCSRLRSGRFEGTEGVGYGSCSGAVTLGVAVVEVAMWLWLLLRWQM